MKLHSCLVLAVAVSLASCGSVEVPVRHSYALQPPAPECGATRVPLVLRIGDFGLDAHLAGDRILARVGTHQLEAFEYHNWAAPLDLLVRDAVYAALLRSGAFVDVVGLGERCDADWVLAGQILAFELVEDVEGPSAWASLVLWLRREDTGALVWRGVHELRTRCPSSAPSDVVAALDRALGDVLQEFLRSAEERRGWQPGPVRSEIPGPRAISRPPR